MVKLKFTVNKGNYINKNYVILSKNISQILIVLYSKTRFSTELYIYISMVKTEFYRKQQNCTIKIQTTYVGNSKF